MDQFHNSCADTANYPVNLVDSKLFQYELETYRQRLLQSENNLCYKEEDSKIKDWGAHVWECSSAQTIFSNTVINSLDVCREHLQPSNRDMKEDPVVRFVFLHAKNARERLNIVMPVLQAILSHHQVTPVVIDQLLSFGRRKDEQEFSACNFRQEVGLSPKAPGLVIPALQRSGRQLQLCYTLRTVEDPGKWRMRQTSVVHSFDVVTGRAFWLVVKANAIVRERIQQVTGSARSSRYRDFQNSAACMTSAFGCHLVMCNWANENWRPYIGELEIMVHKITKPAVTTEILQSSKTLRFTSATADGNVPANHDKLPPSRRSTLQRASTFLLKVMSRSNTAQDPHVGVQAAASADIVEEEDEEDQFSVRDMQEIQAVEERVNMALLVLHTNIDTLCQLKDFYDHIDCFEGWPQDLENSCGEPIRQFSTHVGNIVSDLKLQQARLQTLLSLLSNRKALFYAIIEHRNVEASKNLASRAQQSQDHMEKMTEYTSTIAEKTQKETVSMRIITLVTLFFLPGTFISTLMSTSIIQFDPEEDGHFRKLFSIEALEFFFAVTVPVMVATFLAWWFIWLWVVKRQALRRNSIWQHWQTNDPKEKV